MEAMVAFPLRSLHIPTPPETRTPFRKSLFLNTQQFNSVNSPFSLIHGNKSKSRLFTALSPSPLTEEPANPTEAEPEVESETEKFDWYSQWCPLMPLCDLDKRRPHAKKAMGLDVVIWWDRNEGAWRVFDDACPHRLAPLSEGRIDQSGRLQCVYHGWCFNGSGECKFIPQAPSDGTPFHTFKKACVAAYPSTVQNDMLWFWPSTDPQYKDILARKKPPYLPEIDDPSYVTSMGNRDFPYGYEVMMENLVDPAHVPYSHYEVMRAHEPEPQVKTDREGGRPLELSIEKFDINGFIAKQGWSKNKLLPPSIFESSKFIPPFVTYAYADADETPPSDETKKASAQKKFVLIFICVPVSPGNSRLIWCFPRNFAQWIDKIVPRWVFHMEQNKILDSDLYLLHVEEHKLREVGSANWQKACFVPTKSDALVIAFRKWLNKYAGGQVDWRGKYSGALPPSPPREQLMDRYWSHVVNCRSCNFAYKSLNVVEVALQIISVASIGIVATMKQGTISAVKRNSIVVMAVLSFALSKWLGHFIYKNFRCHDYDHAFI